ncbi:MAG: hypothetical protein H7A23_15415 [Leptospiraceae bacterium]|nr:hypothetical protein [Leptospiraceae bacterium]MCP5495939.1 hypothetical protein [Leptospiraceae bacterium]
MEKWNQETPGGERSLELSPLLAKLKKEVDALIGEYSALWEEEEKLILLVEPELIVKYNLAIERYILMYLNKNLELLQLKRKIEIIQSNLNRNSKIEIALSAKV